MLLLMQLQCSSKEIKMEFFDSHSHLNDEKFDDERLEMIKKIKDEDVTRFLTCG